jgi:glutathione peroxidase
MIYQKYQSRGFVVLAVPCNEFANQEPGTNQEIKEFAAFMNATFPFLAKSNVNTKCTSTAPDACTLSSKICCPQNDVVYNYVRSVIPGAVPWNFQKCLVGKDGVPVKRWPFGTPAHDTVADIEKLLAM